MNRIKTAIISVYDKTRLVNFARFLLSRNITIFSTGGTYRKLVSNIKSNRIWEISKLTQFPELLGGRVKTLHPFIHGGILGRRDNKEHMEELEKQGIPHIDMVVVNLYPFKETVSKTDVTEDEVLENIDIGGHTLIRSGAKNYKDVMVLTDPDDYLMVEEGWDKIDLDMRKIFAKKAFRHVVDYDMAISSYFNPDDICRRYEKVMSLKYGLNPQQKFAGLYRNVNQEGYPFEVLNGNPGYINCLDSAIYGWNLVTEIKKVLGFTACTSYKHTSPAGVAVAGPLDDKLRIACLIPSDMKLTPVASAFVKSRYADPLSSFGDFLSINDTIDVCCAKLIAKEVSDGIIAPGYDKEALEILKKKKGGNYIILKGDPNFKSDGLEVRELHGVTLVQEKNNRLTTPDLFKNIVTKNKDLPESAMRDMIIANICSKYTQSNTITVAKDGMVIGIGAGQQNRKKCAELTKEKVETWYLRQHPKCLDLMKKFKKGTRRVDKINTVIGYIEDGKINKDLFDGDIPELTDNDKRKYLESLKNLSLSSDAFMPFSDNPDIASSFGVKYIIQPGGSVRDKDVINACDKHGMVMCFTGRDMRMFLH